MVNYLLGKELRIYAARDRGHKQQKLVNLWHSEASDGPLCTAERSVAVNRVA